MSDDLETIAKLINSHKGRRSARDLAVQTDGILGKTRWQQLSDPNQIHKASPDIDTIKAVAEALRIPNRRVWLAIGRTLGLDVDQEESPLIARMPAGTSLLTDHQVDLFIDLISDAVATQAAVAKLQGPLEEVATLQAAVAELQAALEEANAASSPVRQLHAARKTTGNEVRGPRGGRGAQSRPKGV